MKLRNKLTKMKLRNTPMELSKVILLESPPKSPHEHKQ
jgi:hypothetical protein